MRTALLRLTSLAGWLAIASAGCSGSTGIALDLGCPANTPLPCASVCVDPIGDAKNCGGCGNVCSQGQACIQGRCGTQCPGGQTVCGDVCANTNADPNNCGACGMKCPPGNVCSGGRCAVSCLMGLTNCGGACVNPLSDNLNCGGCGNACPPGQLCSNGACAVSCQPGLTNCGGQCVNVKSDNQNCGACAMVCPPGNVCSAGMCAVSCQQGLTNCNGVCANILSDNANCGGCATVCPPGNVCSNGVCGVTCQMGLMNCNGSCVNPQSDNGNCGACGNACPQGNVCSMGQCAVSCQKGLMNCSGVCANLNSDGANCGKCGNICPMGQSCQSGVCSATCQNPLVSCNGGCVDPRFDPANCGSCGGACKKPANGVAGCNQGMCIIGMCTRGFLDCNGKPADGCEIDSTTDSLNCAACGKTCAVGSACCNSACINVLTDANNCGGCGKTCQNGLVCCAGACIDPKVTKLCKSCDKACQNFSVSGNDFSNGNSIDQLGVDAMNGLVTPPANMSPPPATSPFVWIAMHDSHQVNKVDAKSGAVAGTFSSRGQNPSRVAVALDNSVWVGNRCPGDPNNSACSNAAQILQDGTPGCTVGKAADGQPMPFVRAMAIDANGFVWVGTYNDRRLHKIDPQTCKSILDLNMYGSTVNGVTSNAYPYGLNVDRNGILWHSDIASGSNFIGVDTTDPDPKKNFVKYVIPTGAAGGGCRYGIVIDLKGNVYWSYCGGNGLWRMDNTTHVITQVGTGANQSGYGLTIDLNGDIYQGSGSNVVIKYQGGTGNFLQKFTFPAFNNGSGSGSFSAMYGIAGDTFGKIWVTDYSSSSVTRFKADGTTEVQTKLPGQTCYNYSDWNAIVLKTVTSNNAQAGTWVKVFDSGSAGTTWSAASWDAVTPKGTYSNVTFKAGNDPNKLDAAPPCGPFFTSPVDLTLCNFNPAEYIQATVRLATSDVNIQPQVNNLKVYYQ